MSNLWLKIKYFFKAVWMFIIRFIRWIIAALVVLAVLIIALVSAETTDDGDVEDDDKSNTPTITQTFEGEEGEESNDSEEVPSISDSLEAQADEAAAKLAADDAARKAEVAARSESETQATEEKTMEKQEEKPFFVAPETGKASFTYANTSLGFTAELPTGTTATEDKNSVTFVNADGSLYSVQNLGATKESLSSIEAQLAGSTSIQSVSKTDFAGNTAVAFIGDNVNGIAVIINDNLFYITGNSQYFSSFNAL